MRERGSPDCAERVWQLLRAAQQEGGVICKLREFVALVTNLDIGGAAPPPEGERDGLHLR